MTVSGKRPPCWWMRRTTGLKPLADHGLLLPGGQAAGWSGRLAGCHVIQRERPQPFPGMFL